MIAVFGANDSSAQRDTAAAGPVESQNHPSAAKAAPILGICTARLKPCPFKTGKTHENVQRVDPSIGEFPAALRDARVLAGGDPRTASSLGSDLAWAIVLRPLRGESDGLS